MSAILIFVAYMAESNMEDVPNFLSMDTDLSLEDYFTTNSRENDVGSNMSDEPWKEFSDGSDSGIDSKYIGTYVVYGTNPFQYVWTV